MQDVPMYSRNGNTCPWGKCSEDAKTLIPPEVKEQLTALAVLNNQSLSEYMRDVLLVHVYGHLEVLRAQRRRGTAETGQE